MRGFGAAALAGWATLAAACGTTGGARDGGDDGIDGGTALDGGTLQDDGGALDGGALDGGALDGGALPDAGGVIDDAGALHDGGEAVDAGLYTSPAAPVCDGAWATPAVDVGPLGDDELVETSGLAASLAHPGVLWSHNDSGDEARVFAIGTDGAARARVALPGVTAVDVEDVATAPCPDRSGPCVWLADTGDNLRARDEVALYVFAEPVNAPSGALVASAVTTLRFTYEDGPVDVEAMVVAPDGSTVWLFEKVDADDARIFALAAPFDPSVVAEAVVVGTIASPGIGLVEHGREITAADLHPTGTRLVLRVYTGIFEYRFDAGESVASVGAPTLVTYGPADEPQGEAVAYDGDAIFSASEDPDGAAGQMLHRFDCE